MPPDARRLSEEGVVFPPCFLVRGGIPQWEAIEHRLRKAPYPSRSPEDNLADLAAALASLQAGARQLHRLAATYGTDTLHRHMKALQAQAADALLPVLAEQAGRIFRAIESLDDGTRLCVRLTVREKHLDIDFDGTSPTHPLNLNANRSVVYSVVLYVLRLLCRNDIPLNEGLLRPVSIRLPSGTCLDPGSEGMAPDDWPAVVGGNTEVSQRLTDTLLKALSTVLQTACSQGTMNNLLFGNERFGYYETIGGGTGAGRGFHGRSGVHQHMTNTRMTDPEELEHRYPVRVKTFALRRGSGGLGHWRGGDGLVRTLTFLEPVEVTVLSQHRRAGPYGLAGGQAGRPGRQWVVRNGIRAELESAAAVRLEAGDSITIETPGGGGYGAPGD
jgi:5-oxoprolinase (ATP-hydrolysing)